MKIVAVTACPTGIAHTYMAQEAIEKECKKRGYEVQVETQGSMGIENELEQEDVDGADVVILAVAIGIDGEDRFEEKMDEGTGCRFASAFGSRWPNRAEWRGL